MNAAAGDLGRHGKSCGGRAGELLNPYRSIEDLIEGSGSWSLRSQQARALLAGSVGIGLTTVGMLLGGGVAQADEGTAGTSATTPNDARPPESTPEVETAAAVTSDPEPSTVADAASRAAEGPQPDPVSRDQSAMPPHPAVGDAQPPESADQPELPAVTSAPEVLPAAERSAVAGPTVDAGVDVTGGKPVAADGGGDWPVPLPTPVEAATGSPALEPPIPVDLLASPTSDVDQLPRVGSDSGDAAVLATVPVVPEVVGSEVAVAPEVVVALGVAASDSGPQVPVVTEVGTTPDGIVVPDVVDVAAEPDATVVAADAAELVRGQAVAAPVAPMAVLPSASSVPEVVPAAEPPAVADPVVGDPAVSVATDGGGGRPVPLPTPASGVDQMSGIGSDSGVVPDAVVPPVVTDAVVVVAVADPVAERHARGQARRDGIRENGDLSPEQRRNRIAASHAEEDADIAVIRQQQAAVQPVMAQPAVVEPAVVGSTTQPASTAPTSWSTVRNDREHRYAGCASHRVPGLRRACGGSGRLSAAGYERVGGGDGSPDGA